MRYIIGIDLGTSAVKSVLFNETGEKIASASAQYPMSQPNNGWAEQDPEDWWNGAVRVIGEILNESSVSPDNIVSLGISGQMHGLVMLNENCEVIRPCILWCDQRTKKECDELTERVGREKLVQITANPALTGFTASKILWVKNNEPKNFSDCRHILLPKDYLRFRLSGVSPQKCQTHRAHSFWMCRTVNGRKKWLRRWGCLCLLCLSFMNRPKLQDM